MSNTSQTDIVTESTREADGSLKIKSIIKLQYGSFISIESMWKPTQRESNLEMAETLVHIGDLSFHLPRSPALLAHTQLVSKQKNISRENLSLIDKTDQSSRKSKRRVHMVTRHDGVEVFLDPLSATFWGGNKKKVKEVSVNTAAFVLKTDGNSVIESATSASAQTWELIDAVLSIISLATQLKSRINDMDISLEELSTRAGVAKVFS